MIDNVLSHRYSDTVFDQKIIIFGPCPPPLGGVSVHIQRVSNKLQQQRNCVTHINTVVEYRYRWLIYYLFRILVVIIFSRPTLLYYHTVYLTNSLPELWLLIQIKKIFGYKIVCVEHDCRHLYQRSNGFKQKYRALVKDIDQLVLIGSKTEQSYRDADVVVPSLTSMEAAFLPPNLVTQDTILKTYPASLHAFMYNHSPVILANAFQLSCIEGKDLYGIDQCLPMLYSLQYDYARLGFVLVLGQVGDENYFRHLCFMIHKLGLAERIYILTHQRELWPLLKRVDLFVRPTLSDGASVSVQEALYFGTPTVASDVCVRPQGTTLYAAGCVTDFTHKVRSVLQNVRKL